MQHKEYNVGKYARITEDAKWTNYNTPTATLPAGSIVRITSWRPEGFNVEDMNGDYFFLFKEYVETAQIIFPSDTVFFIKQREGYGCVSAYVVKATIAEFCGNRVSVWGERNLREYVPLQDLFFSKSEALEDLVSQSERLLKDVQAELEEHIRLEKQLEAFKG